MKLFNFFIVGVITFPMYAFCGSSFDDLDINTKKYIISSISRVIKSCDIAIIHGRSDEWLRQDDHMNHEVRMVLGLRRFRFVTFLKGSSEIEPYDLGYVYPPERIARSTQVDLIERPFGKNNLPPPYRPTLMPGDDLMRLVFVEAKKDMIDSRILDIPRLKTVLRDARNMKKENFVKKYDLEKFFDERVYHVHEGCIFRVNYKIPDLPDTDLMKMNRANQSLIEARVPDLQKRASLITLNKQEVSEIVFICHYVQEKGGLTEYEKKRQNNPEFLGEMLKPSFKTKIGEMLFTACGEQF